MIKESLELRHIGKSFGAVRVLDDINFKLTSGKIYGLAGENGAGKSTTMKIINGAYIADEGEIVIDGETAHFTSPLSAQEAGIGMVYQELNMLPDLSVAENVFISRLSDRKSGYINWNSLHERTGELLKMLDLKLDTHTRLGELKVAHQQLVAIVRALSIECKVVILDEPTSALTEKDSAIVLDAVRRLKELGYIIIYISHKLQEMLTATDEIIVFRNGKKIGQYESKTLDEERLSELIAGRKLEAKFPKKRYPQGKELLRFDHVCVEGYLEDISFTLYEGDILGFAGLLGAGKTEIAKTIFGVFGKNNYNISGKIYFEGKEINAGNPGKSIRNKIGLVPENRASEGLVTDMSVMDNVIMVSLKRMAKFGWIDSKAVKASVDKMIRSLEIKCSGMEQRAGDLSGGNQQKVVPAKWLTLGAKLIIFDEPTRGIDVGAKVAFYELMNELVSEGIGVIIMSSETDEVVNMSDLVVTLKEGRISGVISMRENELLSDKDFQKYM